MKLKIGFSVLIALIGFQEVFSQQDSQFSHYMYNTINVNPAYAGSRGVLSLFGLHRAQWVGLEGAPSTTPFSINTPLGERGLGLGVSFINDRIGPSDENTISGDLSYSIPVSQVFKLSFGVKATAHLLNVDFTKLNIYQSQDDMLQYNIDNKFSPNFGAGVYFHSQKSYLGLSVPSILETEHFDSSSSSASSSIASERMHVYLIGGHVFDLTSDIALKPAFLTKLVSGSPLQLDLSANALFYQKLTLGVSYRLDAAVSALAGFQLTDSFFIGYGYDMDTTELANYNSGSHEVFLRFELNRKEDRVISPRFF